MNVGVASTAITAIANENREKSSTRITLQLLYSISNWTYKFHFIDTQFDDKKKTRKRSTNNWYKRRVEGEHISVCWRAKDWMGKVNKEYRRRQISIVYHIFVWMCWDVMWNGDSTLTFVKKHIANNMPVETYRNGGTLAKAVTFIEYKYTQHHSGEHTTTHLNILTYLQSRKSFDKFIEFESDLNELYLFDAAMNVRHNFQYNVKFKYYVLALRKALD